MYLKFKMVILEFSHGELLIILSCKLMVVLVVNRFMFGVFTLLFISKVCCCLPVLELMPSVE